MSLMREIVILALAAAAAPTAADEPDREAVVAWIAAGAEHTAPAAGTVLHGGDAAIAAFLPPGYAEEYAFPEARLEIQHTTRYRPHPVYREASEAHAGEARLGADGALENYTAGLPFDPARIEAESPEQAGLMVAWNNVHRWQYYGWRSDELVMNYLRPGSGGGSLNDGLSGGGHLERYLTQVYHRVYLSHLAMLPEQDYRVDVDAAKSLMYKDYIEFLEPFDVNGTKFVIERPLDPHDTDRVNSYLPEERRVRRLSAEERADRFMGSDLTMDDFEGFSGRVLDYTWRYLGRRRVLAVFDARRPLVDFVGPESRVPDDRWQVRPTYAVEIISKWQGHPYASKIMFIDAETWNVTVALAFDRQDRMWRIFSPIYWLPERAPAGQASLETSVPRWAATIAIDRLANTATISRATRPTETPTMSASQIRRRFSVSNLTGGR